MKKIIPLGFLYLIFAAAYSQQNSTTMANSVQAPLAPKIPHKIEKHCDVRVDDYFWLNQREHPDVINYLQQENAFYEAETAHLRPMRDALYEETRSRIKEDDE